MAVGVNSGLPSTQSPIANIFGTDVLSSAEQIIFKFLFIFTPTLSKLSLCVSLTLPVATNTVSNISSYYFPSIIHVTFLLLSSVASML